MSDTTRNPGPSDDDDVRPAHDDDVATKNPGPSDPGATERTSPGGSHAPNPETGVGVGAGETSTFEPEEDAESVPQDPRE